MPAGTWNLGRLRKQVEYQGLPELEVEIQDNSTNSDDYFNIIEFPTTLTAGKNLFKLKASADSLVRDSKIYVEVIDSNGNPIYNEPVNYLEQDGTRVVAIYIYPDTPYGTARVYVAGRARIDRGNNNRRLRYSQNVNDRDYFNYPNVMWSRTVTCAPERFNKTEIIFAKKPKLTIREVVQPYLQPVELNNVATMSFGTCFATVKPKPAAISTTTTTVDPQEFLEGGDSRNSVADYYGNPLSNDALADDLLNDVRDPGEGEFAVGTTTEIVNAIDESVMETDCPFFTADMEQGGVIRFVNPPVEVIAGASQTGYGLIPASQESDEQALNGGIMGSANAGTHDMSGSYDFIVSNVLTTTKADIVLFRGFRNVADNNTGGKWNAQFSEAGAVQALRTQNVDEIQRTLQYTASFTLPYVLQVTEQSQSFAEIQLGDIEPATGDVYKVKTLYKGGGAFGEFIDGGDTILERMEIFEDTGSYEATAQAGTSYNRMGFFTSLPDYQKYFTSSQGPLPPTNPITETFEPDDLMSGIRLTPEHDYGVDGFGYIKIKDEYRPNLVAGTQYIFSINTYADLSASADVPANSAAQWINQNKPQLDIYVSGSQGSISQDQLTLNSYITDNFGQYENSLQGNFADGGPFGTRIGSLQLNVSSSITPGVFRFQANKSEQFDVFLVQRMGRFNIAKMSLKTFNETGFTPNSARITTRVPTSFIKTPMTFKFIFYDYLGNPAATEALAYPITFTGENTLIAGSNNLLSGSVYVGTAVGTGIEIAGVNSGFIRSIGYNGFLSASRTDKPGGFLMYTGSVLPETPDNYEGVGFEIVEHSESFFRFATRPSSDKAAGLEIRTPNFFLGSEKEGNFISGSEGNIEITSSNFHLSRTGDVVMQGTITAEAGGTIGGFNVGASELSASNFSLDTSAKRITLGSNNDIFIADADEGIFLGNATMHSAPFAVNLQGAITGSNVLFTGGKIGGLTIDATSLKVGDAYKISGSENALDPASFISSSAFKVSADGKITGSNVLFSSGRIAGWNIAGDVLFSTAGDSSGNGGFALGGGSVIPFFRFGQDAQNNVQGFFFSNTNFGLQGNKGGETVFSLGDGAGVQNQIAGWTFSEDKLQGGAMIIRKDGTIESDGFISNQPGSGFRLTAASGGMLEVENARIRGTLSTAVFEKESVNAVGGQLYVANSTTLTASAANLDGIYAATDTTMSVVNVTGFTGSYSNDGEILSAKKITQTGFATEYILIQSASRNNPASETDLSGEIYVIRGYSGSSASPISAGAPGDQSTIAQSYSGSQVIVSTGRVGTGFIRLNANPNDTTTPYIDIVERTGSAIYDLSLKARLGDLSGITDSSFSDDVTGYGLYTENGYFKGKIEVASLPKPPPTEDLILYYPLQGSFLGATGIAATADLSGNDHNSRDHATSLPDTTFISGSNSGPTGGALSFDGNSTVVENRTIQNSLTNNMDMSVTYWAKKEGKISQRCHWHMTDAANNEVALFMESSGGGNANTSQAIRLMTNNGTEGEVIIDSGSLQLKGEWRHYGVVIPHGGNGILYIDGIKRGTFSGTVDLGGVQAIDAINVGADIDTDLDTRNDYFTGSMADFKVYKKALTTSEIESLYNAPTAGIGRTIIDGNRITTGKIRSNNWDASVGSELDLDAGTIKLGGSSSPTFQVDEEGSVTATSGTIAGWTIDADEIKVGANIGLDSNNKKLTINNTTFGNTGIQLEYNSGTPRAFIGSNAGGFIKFDGSIMRISSSAFHFGNADQFISGSNGILEISSSNFHVSPDGFVKATNFQETVVTVTAANSSSYFEDMTNYQSTSDGVRLIFDGSGGGAITTNMQLDVAPYYTVNGTVKPIADIKVPQQGDGTKAVVSVIVNVDGVLFDDGQIAGNSSDAQR